MWEKAPRKIGKKGGKLGWCYDNHKASNVGFIDGEVGRRGSGKTRSRGLAKGGPERGHKSYYARKYAANRGGIIARMNWKTKGPQILSNKKIAGAKADKGK